MIDSSKKEPRNHPLSIPQDPHTKVKDLISCHLKAPKNTIRLSADSLIVSAGFLIASADTIRRQLRGNILLSTVYFFVVMSSRCHTLSITN